MKLHLDVEAFNDLIPITARFIGIPEDARYFKKWNNGTKCNEIMELGKKLIHRTNKLW